MAFEFKQKEPVHKALRRLGRRRIERALRDLKHCKRLDAVHEVRKGIKQLRALLRLMRPGMSRSDYRCYSEALREAAGYLAAARDAHVKVNALADLTAGVQHELSPQAFREVKRMLAADCRREQAGLSQQRSPKRVGGLLNKLSGELKSARVKKSGWGAIAPGLQGSYRAGRRGYHLARQDGTPEHFHEWRKRVKDLFYQIGLLRPIWPEQMGAAETELKQLGEYLGDDHDVFLLTEPRTLKRFRKKAKEESEALQALVDLRQGELRARALALGARFYGEKPSAFCQRLGNYWKRWRREPKRTTSAL